MMKVLYFASECKPYSKAGGVGDVAGELPAAIKAEGVDIEVVTPCYGQIREGLYPGSEPEKIMEYIVEFHGAREHVDILSADLKGVAVNFVKNTTYFETDYSSGTTRGPFEHPFLFRKDYSRIYVNSEEIPFYDDVLRFSFFCEACIPLIEQKNPDIVHVNDWMLGFLLARMTIRGMPQKRVLTVHNMGYQGNIGRDTIQGWGIQQIADHELTAPLFTDPRLEWNCVNPLRLSMELAHRTNTVSPTYKKEIMQPEDHSRYFEGGLGLHEVAGHLNNQGRLHGILNGYAYQFAPDDALFKSVLQDKQRAKESLVKSFSDPNDLLVGFVGRAVEQKFKLLTEELDGQSVLEHILDIPGVNVVILATGLERYENFLKTLADRPNFTAVIAFDAAIARHITLGSDLFLMPSLFEPCGITQMESLSWATPPLVRWTGGLVDTVRPHVEPLGTGFGFDGSTGKEVLSNQLKAVHDALHLYKDNKERFLDLQRNGFNERFLWSASAKEYIEKLYEPSMREN